MNHKTLFLMLGFPGSGKTTAAKIIAGITGAEHIWADQVRRQIFDQPTYSHQENIELYNKLNKDVEKLLKQGKSVIFDTNFNFYKDRHKLKQIASHNNAQTIIVWVKTNKDIAKQRAVHDAHLHTNTRVLGHMPESHFERIATNMETPDKDEQVIELDGTKIDQEYVNKFLKSAHVL